MKLSPVKVDKGEQKIRAVLLHQYIEPFEVVVHSACQMPLGQSAGELTEERLIFFFIYPAPAEKAEIKRRIDQAGKSALILERSTNRLFDVIRLSVEPRLQIIGIAFIKFSDRVAEMVKPFVMRSLARDSLLILFFAQHKCLLAQSVDAQTGTLNHHTAILVAVPLQVETLTQFFWNWLAEFTSHQELFDRAVEMANRHVGRDIAHPSGLLR